MRTIVHWNEVSSIVKDFYHLVRLPALFLTISIPLFGALSVRSATTYGDVVGLLLIGIAIHFYVYVLNDVVDRDLDATVLGRARKPITRGAVSIVVALAFVLVQLPIAYALTYLFFPDEVLLLGVLLSVSLVMMSLYNIFGKRFPVSPIFADLATGLWAAFFYLFSVVAVEGQIDEVVVILTLFVISWSTYVNGFHCGLRDVAQDYKFGACTTPIWMGARFQDGRLHIPSRLKAYSLVLQAGVTALLVLLWAGNWLGYTTTEAFVTGVLIGILNLSAFGVLIGAYQRDDYTTLAMMGVIHIALITFALPALFVFRLGLWKTAMICLMLAGPFLPPAVWMSRGLKTRWQGTKT